MKEIIACCLRSAEKQSIFLFFFFSRKVNFPKFTRFKYKGLFNGFKRISSYTSDYFTLSDY